MLEFHPRRHMRYMFQGPKGRWLDHLSGIVMRAVILIRHVFLFFGDIKYQLFFVIVLFCLYFALIIVLFFFLYIGLR